MNQAMWISKTGLQAQDAKLQAIANNLANVNTVGYKRDRVVFEDLFYRTERAPGAQVDQNNASPSGVQMGGGTRLVGTQKVFTDGSIQTTGQALDVAVTGKGFMQVMQASGDIGYTRAGQLSISPERQLVNAQGLPLQPQITLPENAMNISIGENGVVTVTTPGSATPTEVGQIMLASFANPGGLLALGGNLYKETSASGPANEGVPGTDTFGKIKQGSLEGANVQVVEEMVEMIAAQRTYEMNAKVLSAADNMLQQLSQAAR